MITIKTAKDNSEEILEVSLENSEVSLTFDESSDEIKNLLSKFSTLVKSHLATGSCLLNLNLDLEAKIILTYKGDEDCSEHYVSLCDSNNLLDEDVKVVEDLINLIS